MIVVTTNLFGSLGFLPLDLLVREKIRLHKVCRVITCMTIGALRRSNPLLFREAKLYLFFGGKASPARDKEWIPYLSLMSDETWIPHLSPLSDEGWVPLTGKEQVLNYNVTE
ncbi:hypothetical protein TIFTF001_015387 [Ficus carica]|uniref:Uncharacterized protein n=1 Tax=Ficus carica TaxID=3494 RepID=A0AA88A7T9_FICCA|nr:hypothetical protein TIFTF001_015387 [Ficus carica]